MNSKEILKFTKKTLRIIFQTGLSQNGNILVKVLSDSYEFNLYAYAYISLNMIILFFPFVQLILLCKRHEVIEKKLVKRTIE